MCLSTVYVDTDGCRQQVMQDVATMAVEKDGYLLVDLFGVEKFVRGTIMCLDFVDAHTVVLEQPESQFQ